MGFFSENEKSLEALSTKKYVIPTPIEHNIIDSCTVIKGDIGSCSNIIIKGKVIGNIETNGIVIIGKNALVRGNINAQSIRIEGKVEGDIISNLLEIRQNAYIDAQKIESKNFYCSGIVNGNIEVEDECNLDENAIIKSRFLKAKNITSDGVLEVLQIEVESLYLKSHSKTRASIKSKALACEVGAKLEGEVVSTNRMQQENFIAKKQEMKRIYSENGHVSI